MSFYSTSSILDQRDEHFYFFKPYHNDQDMGQAWVLLMKYYRWTQCAIISTLDPYGVSAASEFAKAARSRDITVYQVFYSEDDADNLRTSLTDIKTRGHRIIYPTVTVAEIKTLLEEADKLDMLTEKYVWFFTESTASWLYYTCGWSQCTKKCSVPDENNSCKSSLKETCSIDFNTCNYEETQQPFCSLPSASFVVSPGSGHGPKWHEFINYFRENYNGADCGIGTYNDEETNLYHLHHNFLGEFLVDAIEGIAHSFNQEENACEDVSCDVIDVRNDCSEMMNTDFSGATGIINMDKRRYTFFDIINLNYTQQAGQTFAEFNYLGTWGSTKFMNFSWTDLPSDDYKKGLYSSCSDTDLSDLVKLDESCKESYRSNCNEAIRILFKQPAKLEVEDFVCVCYNSNDTGSPILDQIMIMRGQAVFYGGLSSIPLDGNQRELQYVYWDSALAVVVSILIGLILCIISMTASVIIKHQKTPIVKHSSPIFLLTVLVGIGMFTLSLHAWVGKPDQFKCNFRIWLGLIGQILVTAPILSKAWRIWRMFKPRNKVRSSVMTNREFIKYNGILLIVPLILIIIWTATETSDFGVQLTSDTTVALAVCTNGFVFLLVLLVYYFAVQIICCVVSFQIRTYDTGFKESYYLNLISASTLFTSVVGAILSFVLLDYSISIFVCSFISIITTWSLLYIPKLYIILIKKEENIPPPEHDLAVDVMNKGELDNYYSRLKDIQKK